MKGHTKNILFVSALTMVGVLIFVLTIGQSAIDIQLHDTYFALTLTQIIVLMAGPPVFLIFLSMGLTRKFETTWTNIGLIFGLILVSFIIFQVAIFLISYREQIESNSELRALPLQTNHREQFIHDMTIKINLLWGLLGICMTGIGLMAFRTYKLMVERK